MTATSLLKAIVYPLSESRVLVPLIVFAVLSWFAELGGLLGLVLLFLTLLAVFRYQMTLLEARASGRTPETPGLEFFTITGNWWSLFPLVLVVLFGMLFLAARDALGATGSIAVLILASAILPAAFVVLAITHSPLQSMNPFALRRLFARCGKSLSIASAYLLMAGILMSLLNDLPTLAMNIVSLALTFSFFSLTGSLVEPYGVIAEVALPQIDVAGEREYSDRVLKVRENDINHAYGFISRGNREGGFRHVLSSIDRDPDPAAAWAWHFERMLDWDDDDIALVFAQRYCHDLLQRGDNIAALKLMLRCRLINAAWRPDSDDIPAAIAVAESSGNIELAAVLKRR